MNDHPRSGPPVHPVYPPTLGARHLGGGRCRFRVWAPRARRVDLKLTAPEPRIVPMAPSGDGYFDLTTEGAPPGTRGVHRWSQGHDVLLLFHFGETPRTVLAPLESGVWTRRLDSADARWRGPGSSLPERLESSGDATLLLAPHSVAVYVRQGKEITDTPPAAVST